VNLSQRSNRKELLDGSDISFDDIKQNMEELDFINRHLGGHKITVNGIRTLLKKSHNDIGRSISVCEIGCGGGDNMLAVQKWCKGNNISLQLIGIDINPYCIEVAVKKLAGTNSTFLTCDYMVADFGGAKPDYIFSSLFCHHFTNEELVQMLRWMRDNASSGFFINDLHRHRLAFYSIRMLTKLFSRSYLVKNDAPLSVLRGFTTQEWKRLLDAANIGKYIIQWKWAFRHLITVPTSTS
jgi:ubiquinone/menaquinone biosynthesis C-methylase UbiE